MAEKKEKKVIMEVNDESDRKKALEAVIGVIEKEYGKGSIMKLGDKRRISVDVIPTGSLTLDVALGVGGIPKGRVIEIYGPESSGKTTVALHIIAEAQKRGGDAAFVDAEHALDPEYAKKLGVDISKSSVQRPKDLKAKHDEIITLYEIHKDESFDLNLPNLWQ